MIKKDKLTDAKCIFCGGELSWDGQEDASQISFNYADDNTAIVHYLGCRKCGRDYQIIDPVKEERENQFKEYWDIERR